MPIVTIPDAQRLGIPNGRPVNVRTKPRRSDHTSTYPAMSDELSRSRKTASQRDEEPEESAADRARADVGIVAALKPELDPLLSRCDRMRKYMGGEFVFRGGFLRDIRIAFVESGVGGERARRATHAMLDAHQPEWLLSIGFAGGLTDESRIGDVIVANRVVPANAAAPADDAGLKIDFKMQSDPKRGLYVGRLATARHIVHTVAEKREIHQRTGAIAVDMESLDVAEVCRERQVKFLSVRGVTDDCSADLPSEVLSVLGGTGSIRAGAVVGALWKRPGSYRDLWRLRQNANVAGERMALFLVSLLRQMIEPKSW
ncbi:MAG: 5'-methylthioadenosine nucleosidase [Planctomycetaceae bacterium]